MASLVSPMELMPPELAPAHSRAMSRATARVMAYWRSFGLLDEAHLAAAARGLMERLHAEQTAGGPRELSKQALDRAARDLENWLATVLGPAARDPQARPVLLLRIRELLGRQPELFLHPHAAVLLRPEDARLIPEPLPAAMPIQSLQPPTEPDPLRCLRSPVQETAH